MGTLPLAARFAERLAAAGGNAFLGSPADVIERLSIALAEFPGESVLYTASSRELLPDLPTALLQRGITALAAETVDDALRCPVALSAGVLALAETGTIVTTERDLAQRAPSLFSLVHLVVLPATGLVEGLDEAADWLKRHLTDVPYVTFITGPSRTADIERTLTVGVQGPRTLEVILLQE